MEGNQLRPDDMETDWGGIFRELLHRAPAILLIAVSVALLAALISRTLMEPVYLSSTKMYVLAGEGGTLTTGDLQAGSLLTRDYEEIIRSRQVTETVIADLGLTDSTGERLMSHEELLEKISVSTPSDTRVVQISARDSDPYRACDIANAVRDAAARRIGEVMTGQTVQVVDPANIPQQPEGPDVAKNGLTAGIIGALAAAAIVVIRFLTDDTVRTSDDVERYLKLSTLGVIPRMPGSGRADGRKRGVPSWLLRKGGAAT